MKRKGGVVRKTLSLAMVWVFITTGAGIAAAKVQTKTIAYTHHDVQLQGLMAWDDSNTGKRPGILVVHEWWGLNDYARKRAEQLASIGYVAFALDMYGKGKVTDHPDQAGKWMKAIQANTKSWQGRALEGLKILKASEQVDPNRLAAIGYCFGGATVLQLAYSGAPVKGVVSFHGSLPIPNETEATRTKAKILIAHGNADPFLTDTHIQQFRSTLDQAKLDWQMVLYAGARHSFTNPGAGQFGMKALKYDKKADERSWRHMQIFFEEIFH